MPTMEETILNHAKWMADVPAMHPALMAVTRALDTHAKFRAKAAEVAKDPHRTSIGKRDVMQKFIGENAHEIARARKSVEAMRVKRTERLAKLMPLAPDPTNVASAVMRLGMLQHLRAIKNPGERIQILLAPDADIRFLEAVLDAPDQMSNITPQIRELVKTAVIEKRHPGALAQIEKIDEAIELVDVAARVVFNTARDAAEFPSDAVFTSFVETSVGDCRVLDVDLDRSFSAMAEIAA